MCMQQNFKTQEAKVMKPKEKEKNLLLQSETSILLYEKRKKWTKKIGKDIQDLKNTITHFDLCGACF